MMSVTRHANNLANIGKEVGVNFVMVIGCVGCVRLLYAGWPFGTTTFVNIILGLVLVSAAFVLVYCSFRTLKALRSLVLYSLGAIASKKGADR